MKRVMMLAVLAMSAFAVGSVHAQDENDVGMTSERQFGTNEGVMGLSGRIFDTELGTALSQMENADTYLKYSSQLKLSDSQISRLRSIQTDHGKAVKYVGERLQVLEGELRRLLTQDNTNLDYLKSKVEEAQSTLTERLLDEVDYVAKSRAVLNNDQLSMAIALVKDSGQEPMLPVTSSSGGMY